MRGRASWRAFTSQVLEAFPDMQVEIDEMVADGNAVAVRWHAEGTHTGEFLGLKPTGKKVPMTNFDIFYIKDGQISGALSHADAASVFEALGVAPGTPTVRSLRFHTFDQERA